MKLDQQKLEQLSALEKPLRRYLAIHKKYGGGDPDKLKEYLDLIQSINTIRNIKNSLMAAKTTLLSNGDIPINVDLDFFPRSIHVMYYGKEHKLIPINSTALPPYSVEFNISLPSRPDNNSRSLIIKGSEFNTSEIKEIVIPSYELSSTTVILTLTWNAGDKYVINTEMINDCDDLNTKAYETLQDGLEEVYKQLHNIKDLGVNYFNSINSSYTIASNQFKKFLNKQNEYKDGLQTIKVNVLTMLSVGALSWIANLSKLADITEDITTVAIDKSMPALAEKSTEVRQVENDISLLSEDIKNNLALTTFVDAIIAIDNKLSKLFGDIFLAKTDVTNYCENINFKRQLELYTDIADKTKNEINQIIPSLKEYSQNFKVIEKNKLAEEFEFAFWVRWIPCLKNIKTEDYDAPMGGAGRSPNYPIPGKKEPRENPRYKKGKASYDGGLCRELRDHLRSIGIEKAANVNLDFSYAGLGDIPSSEIEKLVKWASSQNSKLKLSL
ncbi:MAG: hypothetical protein GY810_31960 [Aureispira sp.]|nr:hypothetical protein [Aureispira sp.]